MHNRLHRAWIDPQMQREKPIQSALIILGVAGRQSAMPLDVLALGNEPRKIQQTGRPMRQIGRRELGEDFPG